MYSLKSLFQKKKCVYGPVCARHRCWGWVAGDDGCYFFFGGKINKGAAGHVCARHRCWDWVAGDDGCTCRSWKGKMCVCVCVCVILYIYISYIYIILYIYVCVCVYIYHTYIQVVCCEKVEKLAYIHSYTYNHVRVFIYVYSYTYIHIRIFIYRWCAAKRLRSLRAWQRRSSKVQRDL